MAGRREYGSCSTMDGHQTGDYVVGKSLSKDQSRRSKKGCSSHVSIVTSPPTRKSKSNFHNRSNGRHGSNQRLTDTQPIAMEDIEYVEKDILAKERKKSGHLSLSHLLNFTVTPRERNYPIGSHYGVGSGYRHYRKQNSYNKEQFLQANCQFVVKDGGDYSIHITESDPLVDWCNIEQVRLFSHDIPSCPVCLYLPTAAKITRCGHVFCSSCILHYLTLSDKKWRKCPICYESIYKHDLKSVTTFASKRYKVNDIITMKLMKRKKGTTIVMPCAVWDDSDIKIQQLNDDDRNCQFSKLVIATSDQIVSNVVTPELEILHTQLSTLTPDEESERCFIEAALEDLKLRMEKLVKNECDESLDPEDNISSIIKTDDVTVTELYNSTESLPTNNCINEFERSSTDIDTESPKAAISNSPKSEYVYFYQADDGQQLYIHPLNGKALVTEYGGWDKCPCTITAQIVEIEQYSMTEDEKFRSKYLNHLPLTCEFALCEVELGSPILSPETIDMFYEQFQKRKQRRQRKKRDDKRQEKKQTRNESGSGIVFSSENITPEHFHDFLSIASSPPLPSHLSSNPPTHNELSPPSVNQPSFAQALAKGDKKLSQKPSPTQSPVSSTGVKTEFGLLGSECIETMNDDFENQIVPSFQNSFSNALLSGRQEVLVSTENQRGKPGGSKSAKKGRKKIVLFSTAGGNHRI